MSNAKVTLCRHCSKNKACKPRGLCFGCYQTPSIRKLYPTTSIYAGRSDRLTDADILALEAAGTPLGGSVVKDD